MKKLFLVLTVIFLAVSCGSDNKWDKIIDDYESYADNYIKLVKKAQNGDISAISEYSKCMENAAKLEEQLRDAEFDLTEKQLKRLEKIGQKLAKAYEGSVNIKQQNNNDDDF